MQRGIERALQRLDISYDICDYTMSDWDKDDAFVEKFTSKLKKCGYDTVFSVDFAPVIADVCYELGIHYISWVYDCPVHIRRTDTIGYNTNDVYFFDRNQVDKYRGMGYGNVHHLVLAVDTELFGADRVIADIKSKATPAYECDVSLLGQLYKSDFNYLCTPLDNYYRGYLEGCVQAQMQVAGGYILNEMVTEELMDKLNVFYMKATKDEFKVKKEELEYALACEATGRERYTTLAILQSRCNVRLYSGDTKEGLDKLKHCGYVDYYDAMPKVFANSRINLNVSLKAISSGIPLRVLDIIGSGGFVISNIQPELFEYFTPGEDIVMYEDIKDLVYKAEYYLKHESERLRIQVNAYNIVKEAFSFDDKIRKMLL